MENPLVCSNYNWDSTRLGLVIHTGKSSVRFCAHLDDECCSNFVSWLIDNDRDSEGMRVIADLHGGDPEDVVAVAEYEEIKERVMWEVRSLL